MQMREPNPPNPPVVDVGCPQVRVKPLHRPVKFASRYLPRGGFARAVVHTDVSVLVCAYNRLKEFAPAVDNPARDVTIQSVLEFHVEPGTEERYLSQLGPRPFMGEGRILRFGWGDPLSGGFGAPARIVKEERSSGVVKVTVMGYLAKDIRPTKSKEDGTPDDYFCVELWWQTYFRGNYTWLRCATCPLRTVVPTLEPETPRPVYPPPYREAIFLENDTFVDRGIRYVGSSFGRAAGIQLLDQFGDPLHFLYETSNRRDQRGALLNVLYERFEEPGGGRKRSRFLLDAMMQTARAGWVWMRPPPPDRRRRGHDPVLIDANGFAKDPVIVSPSWLQQEVRPIWDDEADTYWRKAELDALTRAPGVQYTVPEIAAALRGVERANDDYSRTWGGEALMRVSAWGHVLETTKIRKIEFQVQSTRSTDRPFKAALLLTDYSP